MQAMMAGDLDVAYVGAAPVITALSQGLDAKIVEPVQINGSSLVLRPEYKYESPKDLKGLTIATYPARNNSGYTAQRLAQEKWA